MLTREKLRFRLQDDDGDARENTQQEDVVSRPPQPSPGATMSDDASSDIEMSDEVKADPGPQQEEPANGLAAYST